ncbi:MAG: sulfurtransferase [Microbacteriaceae bacterium]|nr:sulfurtransferase [Microbacteriaceae bacterium]
MTARDEILATPAQLAAELASGRPPVVLDVRWRLGGPDGWDEYVLGHIAGSVYVKLDLELADPWHAATAGRHPLPTIEDFENAARNWGIRRDSRVVVVDDSKGLAAGRAWWLLRYAGFPEVRLLDGGLKAWRAAGLPLVTEITVPERGDVTLAYGALPVLDIDGAAAFPEHGVLLDARARERFRGEVEPVDPVAGHIPGAVNAPTTENVDESGAFLDAAALRARFEALGVSDDGAVAVYCGSGVTAAHEAIALTLAGFRPVLYPGSWSEWSNHPDRPVAVGD